MPADKYDYAKLGRYLAVFLAFREQLLGATTTFDLVVEKGKLRAVRLEAVLRVGDEKRNWSIMVWCAEVDTGIATAEEIGGKWGRMAYDRLFFSHV